MDNGTIKEELRWRREVTNIYTKARDDFPTKESFDDYLEEMEDLIYRLTFKENFEEARQRLRRYALAHQDEIAASKARKADAARSRLPEAQAGDAAAAAANPFGMPLGAMAPMAPSNAMPRLESRPAWVRDDFNVEYSRVWPKDRELVLAITAAGGWHREISRKRARQEAFGALFTVTLSVE